MADLLTTLRNALAPDYEVERQLGAGGMGAVFLARDRTLDRQVAIKIVSPELTTSEALRQRFLHEARTIARLRHPNIVDVYTAGESGGLLYFVMQCVQGESLRDMLDREKRIPAQKAAVILRDLANALAYAHERGVIHRDIKPENVLIDERDGTAHLTDFGVARALEASDERMTGTGLVVGSPRYMSPEQAAGERQLDGRSDIYSLGLVGYEMVSGGPTISGASPVSIIAKQITEVPPPVATRAPDVPPALGVAIDRALAKDPNDRWPTAAEFAAAIGDAIEGRTTATTKTAWRSPAQRRSRTLAIAAAIVVVLLAAGGFWVSQRGDIPAGVDPRKSILVTPFEVLGGDPALAWLREGSVNMLTLNLATWTDLTVVDYERSLDLLRAAGLDDADRVGLEEARGVARRAGVWTVVLGQVSRVGDSLIVVARAFDVSSGKRIDIAQRSALATSDPRPLFDGVARDLLDLAGAPPMRPELAQTTTQSLEAYRSYVTGLRDLNRWRLQDADSAFARAIAADSTFALAYYKRALARGWSRALSDTTDTQIARAAVRHGTRLPQREREIMQSYYELTKGLAAQTSGQIDAANASFLAAQQGYASVIARDSSDAEAWYGIADAYFHHAYSHGPFNNTTAERLTRALRAFTRTLALDSTFHLAYAHKVAIYQGGAMAASPTVVVGDSVLVLPGDSAQRAYGMDRVQAARARARDLAVRDAQHWLFLDPDAPQAHLAVVDGYTASANYDSAVAALRTAIARPDVRSAEMPYLLSALELSAGRPEALGTLRTALDTYTVDSLRADASTRRLGSLMAAGNVAAYHGALGEYDRLLAMLTELEPTLPGANIPTRMIAGTWRAMTRLASGIDSPGLRRFIDSAIVNLDRLDSPIAGAVRSQSRSLPLIAFLTTRDSAYVAPLRRWGSRRVPVELEALIAIERGDTARALELSRSFEPPDSTRVSAEPGAYFSALAQAEVFAELGNLRRAVEIYELLDRARFGAVSGVDGRWPLRTRSHLARARLYEQLGDPRKAIAAYEKFLEIWKDAAPPLQDQLRVARESIARLRDAPGQPMR